MNIDSIFSDIAQKEVRESFDWYEERLIGLGIDFIEAIDTAVIAISKNPEAYQNRKIKTNAREFVVKRFPYIIVYRFSKKDSTVYILHIFHTSRHPKFKYRKK